MDSARHSPPLARQAETIGADQITALVARLFSEAKRFPDGALGVRGTAHRWHALHDLDRDIRLTDDSAPVRNPAEFEAFCQLVIVPARNLGELVRKLAVLHQDLRADSDLPDPCTPSLALLGSILADAVALAAAEVLP